MAKSLRRKGCCTKRVFEKGGPESVRTIWLIQPSPHDGRKTTKQHTVDDFIACARLAVEEKLTSPAHLSSPASVGSFGTAKPLYDVKPAGNAVNLEDQMIKVANNQMDYQAATSLYSRSMGLFKVAIGKK